ncbi:hypothetical protein B566_EDAN018503, partial [Ephemera danica]
MIFGILVLVIVGTSSLPLDGDGIFLSDSQEKAYEKIVMEIRNKSRGFVPDRRVGEKVAKWKPGQGNPEELGSYFEGYAYAFDKINTITYGVPYDYGSVMHYGKDAFSKNGLDTIVPKYNWVTIGQHTHLSNSDITKIRQM